VIVDCHCHAGPGDGFSGPWDTTARLGPYLARASRAGIDRTTIFAAFHSDYRKANDLVGRLIRRRPDRFFGFVFVHAEASRNQVRPFVSDLVARYGFCGLKVHRRHARITREIAEVASDLQLPVIYDVMGEVAPVELLAREFPRVAFILPHLGSFGDDWAAQMACTDLLVRVPNVYADTAGVRYFDHLEQAVRRAGPAKILFGSDGPWLHPALELDKIRQLRLAHADEALLLGGNFLRLTSAARRAYASRFASSICSARSVIFKSRAAC